MEIIEYDVVVVGSGIAGAVVAKTLTDAGKKVLVLDAGLNPERHWVGKKRTKRRWDICRLFTRPRPKRRILPIPI